MSGCEKINDHTLKKLSVGLGDLMSSSSDKRSERRAKLLESSPVPIPLLDERKLRAVGRKQQAIIFKHGTARWGTSCIPTHVWVLNTSDLADIEDAAKWSHHGGVSFTNSFAEMQLLRESCCCRRSRRLRTGSDSSYLHQQFAVSGDMFCGHSTCCSNDKAFRTLTDSHRESGITRDFTAELRTKCLSSGGLQCLEPENRTDRSKAKRSLKFLSLSGCYQITDLGLR